MKPFHGLLAAGLLAHAASAQDAAPPRALLDLLPADTLAFIGCDDARAAVAAWKDSSIGRLHSTPEYADYVDCYIRGIDDVLEMVLPGAGLTVEALQEWPDGPAAFALLDVMAPDAGEYLPSFTLALIVGIGAHDLELQDVLLKADATAVDHDMVASHSMDGDTDVLTLRPGAGRKEDDGRPVEVFHLAVHRGMLLATCEHGQPRTDALSRLLGLVDGQGGAALGSRADVRSSLFDAEGADLRTWVDVPRLKSMASTWIAGLASAASGHPGDMAHVLDIANRLGADTLGVLTARYSGRHDATRRSCRLSLTAASPLRDAITCCLGGSDRTSLLSIAPERPLFAAAAEVDWTGLFDAIVRCLMVGARLEASDVTAGLADMTEELGFDLREDLLARLDGRFMACFADVPAEEALSLPGELSGLLGSRNGLVAFGVSDADGLRELLDQQLRQLGLHAARQTTRFLGFELTHLPVLPGIAVDYAILPDLIVLSTSPTLVQDAVRRAASPDLPDFAARPDIVAGLAALAVKPGVIVYSDELELTLLGLRMKRDQAGAELPRLADLPGKAIVERMLRADMESAKHVPDVSHAFLAPYFRTPDLAVYGVEEGGFFADAIGP